MYKLTGFLFYFNDLALSMHSTGSQFDHDHAPILMETMALFLKIINSWRNGLDADPLRQLFIIKKNKAIVSIKIGAHQPTL